MITKKKALFPGWYWGQVYLRKKTEQIGESSKSGILMGILWEAYHKGVPLLGVPENPTDPILPFANRTQYLEDLCRNCKWANNHGDRKSPK